MNKEEVFNKKLLDIALRDKNSYFILMDGTEFVHASLLHGKIEEERIINAGISEQNAVGMASGIAMTGKNVYLIGCPFFVITRAYEQIRNDIAYNNANVKIWGTKSGIASYPQGGYGHWGIDDISLMRNLPNFIIASCATAQDVSYYLEKSITHKGPMYLMDENCWCELNLNYNIEFGKFSQIGKGRDFAIITTGHSFEIGYDLYLKYKNIFNPVLINVNCLKPFDKEGLLNIINKNIPIISIDEHTEGGLTGIISNIIAKTDKSIPYHPIYIKTDKCNICGSYKYIAEQTMEYNNIHEIISDLLTRKPIFGIIKKKIKLHDFTNANFYYKLFDKFTITKIKLKNIKHKKQIIKRLYLFGTIPFLKYKKTQYKRKYYLFGIPIYTKRKR